MSHEMSLGAISLAAPAGGVHTTGQRRRRCPSCTTTIVLRCVSPAARRRYHSVDVLTAEQRIVPAGHAGPRIDGIIGGQTKATFHSGLSTQATRLGRNTT